MLKQQLKKYVNVVQKLRRDDRIPSDHDLATGTKHLFDDENACYTLGPNFMKP